MRQVVSFEQFFESIWLKIPEVWRTADVDQGRPLQLLTLTLAQHFYYSFYLKIASMDELFDYDKCPEKYLPFLASIVNWKLLGTNSKSWRNQIKHAPLLYKIKGTRKSLTIAEKLIGYSVFMTELYRDYTGNIVPKEKVFNNFPLSIKIKPWFRKTSSDLGKDIFNDFFSDLLPSFNAGSGDITNFGSLLLPRKLKKVSSQTISLSSTTAYNSVTGSGSLARLAKTSRINVILKKDVELDYIDVDGKYADANLNEALDLFLQFKPFHVYIQDLLVLHSLSDYIFGSQADKDGGTGDLPGEVILSREDIDIYVTVREEDRFSYYNQEIIELIPTDLNISDTSRFKGVVELKYELLNIHEGSSISDVSYLTSLGFPLSGYARDENSIWSPSDFMYAPSLPNNIQPVLAYEPPVGNVVVLCKGTGVVYSLVDSYSQTIYYSSIIPEPKYSFQKVNHTSDYLCDLVQLHGSLLSKDDTGWYSDISECNIEKNILGKDAVVIDGTSYSNQSTPSTPWSLNGLQKLYTSTPATSLVYKTINTVTGAPVNITLLGSGEEQDKLELLRYIFKQNMLLLVTYASTSIYLMKKVHYVYDAKNQSFIFNMYAIANSLNLTSLNQVDLFNAITVEVVYPCLIPTIVGFSTNSGSRNVQISNVRKNIPFNRITYVDNSNIQTEIDTAHYTPVLEFDDELGILVEDTTRTKLFKTPLPKVFTRNCLHLEDTGTPYLAVNYDNASCRDTSKWTVYIDPATSTYVGPEQISKTIWANYFNVPFINSVCVPYDGIDKSEAAQIAGRTSFRWQATVNNIPTTHSQYWASSRQDTPERRALWTRGSASKMARPYIGTSRKSFQGFRDINALFNRTDELPDYKTSLAANYNTDKYKYTVNDLDYTDIYRNPTSIFIELPIPTTEVQLTEKTTIVNNKIIYPAYSGNMPIPPQYEEPFDSTHRESYFTADGNAKPSLYANNIRSDIYSYTDGLLDDFADLVDINIEGLIYEQSLYTITSNTEKEFILPKINVFISWREVNTGLSMGTGLYPYVTSSIVRPSIQVIKNGIELVYGDYWIIAAEPVRIILTDACLVTINDTIEVLYQALDNVEFVDYPENPITHVPYDGSNTEAAVQIFNVPLLFNNVSKVSLLTIPFEYEPVISWNRSDTADFINVSVNVTGILLTPIPKMYKELAVPNVQIFRNATELVFGIDWKFIATINTIMYAIVLNQKIVSILSPSDVITINYTKLK